MRPRDYRTNSESPAGIIRPLVVAPMLMRHGNHTLAFAALLFVLCLSAPLVADEPAGPGASVANRVAILTDTRGEERERLAIFSDLLGLSLQEGGGLALLERDQFEAVLGEITVSQLIGADAVSERLHASALLDADVLVMVHHPQGRPDQIAVTLIEARNGLRLAGYILPGEKNPEQAAPEISASIREKLQRASKGVRVIVAVPPFVDARLDPQPARFGVQLAESVQAVVGAMPGVLVLEVDEARALAREMKVRGDGRLKAVPDPLFLTGRITTGADGGHGIELKAERNGLEPITRSVTAGTLAELAGACLTGSEELVAESADELHHNQASNDAALQRLLHSAAALESVGDAYQACDLVEMAVLLNPDSPALRERVMKLIATRMSYIADRFDGYLTADQKHEQLLEQLELGLEHHYAGNDLILRQGNRELRNKGRRPVVIEEKYLAATYNQCVEEIESGGVVLDRGPAHAMLARHIQRLYRLLTGSDEQVVKEITALSISRLFLYRRSAGPALNLTFEQQLDLYLRFQERPDAGYFLLNLWGGMPLDQLRESIALMDDNLDRLTVRGQMVYEYNLTILLDNEVYYMYNGGPAHRSPEIAENLKQPAESRPEEPGVSDSAISARPIDLFVSDPEGEDGRRAVYPKGWLNAGRYGELVYDNWHVYLITGVDQVKAILAIDPEPREEKRAEEKIWIPRRLTRPCFDGRYVWVGLISDPGRLFIVDLETLEVSRFSEGDGLFPMAGGVAIAPLGEGDVLVTASTVWDDRLARVWSGRTRFSPEDGLAMKIIYQALPGQVIEGRRVYSNIRNADTLSDPVDPTKKFVAVDHTDALWIVDDGSKLIISPDTGEVRLLRWGKYDSSGIGLALCYVHDGLLYFSGHRAGEVRGVQPVWRYTPGAGRFEVVRPAYEGQGVTGMVQHAEAYLAVDTSGTLWASRSLTDIAREIGPITPVLRLSDLRNPPDDDWERSEALWEFRKLNLFISEYFGLIGWYYSENCEDNGEDRKSWSIDLGPEHLARIDQPPAIPTESIRLGGRALLNVMMNATIPEAQRIAEAYGARLATVTDRTSYDEVGAVATGNGKWGHHWVGLERRGDQVLNLNDEGGPVKIEGVPLGGAKEGYVLGRWDPPALTGASPTLRHKFILEWPLGRTDDSGKPTDITNHPGPAWLPVVELPAGRFTMGNTDPDSPYAKIEPLREVEIPAGLWMATTEVTVAQYNHVMNHGPMPDGRPSPPQEARSLGRFCKLLSQMTGLNYRIPTEEEWEYACRAGTDTLYASGDTLDDLRRIGWCSYDGVIGSAGHFAYAGSFEPNAWGLYDMHGNFAEFTCTFLGDDMLTRHTDPGFGDQHRSYIIRGGSWVDPPSRCRSASRRSRDSITRFVGFRVVLDTREPDGSRP